MRSSWFPSGSFFQPILEDIFAECVTDGVSNFTPVLIVRVSL